jgi:hypothetical protein
LTRLFLSTGSGDIEERFSSRKLLEEAAGLASLGMTVFFAWGAEFRVAPDSGLAGDVPGKPFLKVK